MEAVKKFSKPQYLPYLSVAFFTNSCVFTPNAYFLCYFVFKPVSKKRHLFYRQSFSGERPGDCKYLYIYVGYFYDEHAGHVVEFLFYEKYFPSKANQSI